MMLPGGLLVHYGVHWRDATVLADSMELLAQYLDQWERTISHAEPQHPGQCRSSFISACRPGLFSQPTVVRCCRCTNAVPATGSKRRL